MNNMIKITEDYGITFDKYNMTLMVKYEKREGKGKHSPLSGEFGWREEGHYGNFKSFAKGLAEYEIKNNDMEDFQSMIEAFERLTDEMGEILKDKIEFVSKFEGERD